MPSLYLHIWGKSKSEKSRRRFVEYYVCSKKKQSILEIGVEKRSVKKHGKSCENTIIMMGNTSKSGRQLRRRHHQQQHRQRWNEQEPSKAERP